ncbi:MAG: bifunctional UDP-3-O-[3-hydroxymyristoyl] N-acetylglucosamine deacetylase/3-hydroxyacyl-ACP dehydratase [Cytophagales bacterium]|nr:bifunctional UDP-3-O-[3-hydroxymyristoyl] N-acetylglucosamine deacetylase/3-hydroxyacyl-ACP dehydratase [Cytophagales bacterium]
MNTKQHTIKKPVALSGVGLHTGLEVTMTFLPAPPNHGIKFQRIDLEDSPTIDANVEYVVDVSRGTTLEQNDARVGTIEHTLAALTGLEIDNVLIQLDASEAPIMDGSAMPFVKALEEVGTEEQDAPRNFFEVHEGIFYRDKDNEVEIAALPLDDYRVTVMIDYNSPVLGNQHASLTDIKKFEKEIAACRTFSFLHELETLYNNNLIKGGNLSNAVVVVDRLVKENELVKLSNIFNIPDIKEVKEGILNNVELRYRNEPARHKLLDLVGDLTLAGRPIKAQILAARPGHAANVAFAKKLRKHMLEYEKASLPQYDSTSKPLLDINKITKILPHRYPFQLVDKITQLDNNSVTGVKNVSINEPFFQGHFPNNPVMPGVLQVEALAQTGGILVLSTISDPENYWTYLLAIDDCRFRKIVLPGDTLVLKCEFLAPVKRGFSKVKGQAFVGNNLVCEAVMTAKIVEKSP